MNARMSKIVATAAVALAGVGFIVYSAMAHKEPQKDADALVKLCEKDVSQCTTKRLAVHGYVEAGSIKEDVVGQKTITTFVVAMNDGRVRVRHHGPKPDTFRDGAEVVAKGRVVDENGQMIFEARELMAKCPSKYDGGSPAGYNGGGQKPVFNN